VKIGLKMLTLDGIGGSGSRGYGKIEFDGLTLNGQAFDLPETLF
jgi:CRISPR-associated protein Csm3